MTEVDSKDYIIGNYYINFSSRDYMKYLGESTYDGCNFICTHRKNEYGEVVELSEEDKYKNRIHFVGFYTNKETDYLNYITSKKGIRDKKIEFLLSD